jgi:hypothetical protein
MGFALCTSSQKSNVHGVDHKVDPMLKVGQPLDSSKKIVLGEFADPNNECDLWSEITPNYQMIAERYPNQMEWLVV